MSSDPASFGTDASSATAVEAATEAATASEEADPERRPELEPGGRHAVAEGHAEPTSSTDIVWEALTSTSPNTPLEQVESPWNPAQGGMARIFRGVQKMTDTDTLPAWADVLIGTGEFVVKQQDEQTGESSQQETADGNTEIQVS